MGVGYFRCSEESVEGLYSLFNNLSKEHEELLESILNGEKAYIRKNIVGEIYLSFKDKRVILPSNILSNLECEVVLDTKEKTKLENLRDIDFSESYLYSYKDVNRASNYGFNGRYNSHISRDSIYKPSSVYKFSDVCEVDKKYISYINNGYKKLDFSINSLVDFKERIVSNSDYVELFKGYLKKGISVNRLFESNGNILCKSKKIGYQYLENLEDIEGSFYNKLLDFIVGLGIQINSVYFYSDLNWSSLLYRESKVDGEYEILIK